MDWFIDNLALLMFVAMFVVIFCGYPVAFVLGGAALCFALTAWALGVFPLIGLSNIILRMWGGVASDPVLVSIPMFIFMGSILQRGGSAKDMLDATEVLLRRVPGGLAVAVMVMGTILAAPIGVVGAAVVLLSVIALPQMLASGYDKELALGTVASAGTLGILIPPPSCSSSWRRCCRPPPWRSSRRPRYRACCFPASISSTSSPLLS